MTKAIRAMSTRQHSKEVASVPLGLRGLNNLGSTCYMNSVLQALLHTPPLQRYFLECNDSPKIIDNGNFSSLPHSVANSNRSSSGPVMNGCEISELCLTCNTKGVFSASFSGARPAFNPSRFMYSWWRYGNASVNYGEQDAHDFFISILSGIHYHTHDASTSEDSTEGGSCPCIAHKTFSGLLRSDVTCMTCGVTSTTLDPCLDISLDLDPGSGKREEGKQFLRSSASKKMKKAMEDEGSLAKANIVSCLEQFTREEYLGANEKFFCENCKSRQERKKQMSVFVLPSVLCLHLKRFEHSTRKQVCRKIESHVDFPDVLDMNPYLSPICIPNNEESHLKSSSPEPRNKRQREEKADHGVHEGLPGKVVRAPHYEVFAVISHSGQLDSGHYVCYLRLEGKWYKCDDAWITRVDEKVVRATQVYMLYYSQSQPTQNENNV